MDCDRFGLRFHKIIRNGSERSAHMNLELSAPRMRPIGILPHQMSPLYQYKCRKLSESAIAGLKADLRAQMKHHGHIKDYIENVFHRHIFYFDDMK